jgi:hypothetical protein
MTHASSSSYDTCILLLIWYMTDRLDRDGHGPPHVTHASSSSYDTCILLLIWYMTDRLDRGKYTVITQSRSPPPQLCISLARFLGLRRGCADLGRSVRHQIPVRPRDLQGKKRPTKMTKETYTRDLGRSVRHQIPVRPKC